MKTRTTLADVLDQVTQAHSDETAFVYLPDGENEADSLTFGQLAQRARALAARMVANGLSGERALLSAPPGTDFVVALAGCFLANVTAVPMVPEFSGRASRHRLRHIIADCTPAVELTSTLPSAEPQETSGQDGGERDALPCLSINQPEDTTVFTRASVTPESLAIIQYTSGSTTSPRGVMLSHRNVLANLAMLERIFGPSDGRPTVGWLPLHHDMGLFGNVLRSLYSGGRCVLMPPSAFLRQPLRWLRAIDRYGAFASGGPNFAYDMCVRRISEAERDGLDLSHWKVAFNGSEPVRADTLARFSAAFAPAGFAPSAFLPGYGLAEATLVVSGAGRTGAPAVHELSGAQLRGGEVVAADGSTQEVSRQVSCGPPCPGVEVALVDPDTRQVVPEGRLGELWLRGENIAGGYWNRPELSAEVFGARLAEEPDGKPYLRTGDLGGLLHGELVITGRLKDLVIIRGANYYPQDIEHTVRECLPPQRAGVTAVFAEEHDTAERLVVVQELRPSGVEVAGVCNDIHKQVMLEHGVAIDRIVLVRPGQVPRTSSGKVQRSRCRELLATGRLAVVHDDIPATDRSQDADLDPGLGTVESILDDLRAMIGGLVRRPPEAISADEPPSAARVDSLHAAELLEHIQQRFGVEVEISALLGKQTVRQLAEAIHTRGTNASRERAAKTSPSSDSAPFDPFPLTALQAAYFAGRSPEFELGGVGTHVYLEYLHGDLDVPRVVAAWELTVRRHDMLRAVVTPQGGQRVLPELAEPIHVDDYRDQPNAAERVRGTRERMSHQVLDQYQGPLFEVRLSRLPNGDSVVHISLDLLILDASGVLAVLQEWGRHYAGTGEPGPVAGPSFRDYMMRRMMARPDRAAKLAQAPVDHPYPGPGLPLAVDPATIGVPTFRRRAIRLSPTVWRRLADAAQTRGVTQAALLGAAFSEVLARHSEQRPFSLTVTSFTRPADQVGPEVVGEFTTLLLVPVRHRCEDFETRLREFSDGLATALQHRNVDRVAVLADQFGGNPTGQPPRPLAPVVFTCLIGDITDLGWLGEPRYAITQTPQVWLDHQVTFTNGCPELVWDAVEELFPAGLLDAMFEAYQRLLHSLAERGSWRVTGAELAGLPRLAGRAASPAMRGSDQTLDQLIEAQLQRTPDAEAVFAGGRRISYRELAAAGRNVAARLLELGLCPGDLAVVALPKGWPQIAAVLGTLWAGGVYVPAELDLSDTRMGQLLADCTARFVVTTPAAANSRAWATQVGCVVVDEASLIGLAQAALPLPRVDRQPGDLAYVIYTSGSTGTPKGVAIEHRGAVNTVLDLNDRFGVGPADAILGVTPLSFDLSVYDIFGPLSAGGRLVLPDHDRRGDPAHWVELLVGERVTLWNSVPALLRLLAEDPASSSPGPSAHGTASHSAGPQASAGWPWARRLRLVLLSGDWIGVDFADRLRRHLPRARLVSLGGATEASVWSVAYEINVVDPTWTSVPYGTALRGQDAIVLDDQLEPRPVLVPGPLYLGGVGLAREYWRDAVKTAASFVVHPGTGRRLYRTGDLATLRPDGNLELLGREDNQLKVQGHRIEPGEVEAALTTHPDIAEAVVGAVGPRDGVRRLIAYVRLHPSTVLAAGSAAAKLRDHVAGLLPRYLVPDSVRVVNAFPLTTNGKLDREALFTSAEATPQPAPVEPEPQAPLAQRQAVTEAVLRAVGAVAAESAVTEQTRLAELEFTSVHLVRLANALAAEFGRRPRLDDLYRMKAIEELIRYYQHTDAPQWTTPGVIAEKAERAAFLERHHSRPAPAGTGLVIMLPGAASAIEPELLARRTAAAFATGPIPVGDLAAWLGCLRSWVVDGRTRQAWGSAGGIYPISIYLQVHEGGVCGLAPGVYYYDRQTHALTMVAGEVVVRADHHRTTDNRRLHQQAAAALFLVADLDAITPLYGELAERFALIEAGSISQLLEVRAARHGLGTRAIGAVDFATAATALELRAGQSAVYSLLVGPATAAPPRPDLEVAELDQPLQALPITVLRSEVEAHVGHRTPRPRAGAARDGATANRIDGGSRAILVTGGTGFLGSRVIAELLQRTDAVVYGLVRAPDRERADRRLHEALRRHSRPRGREFAHRLIGIAGDVSCDRFDLPADAYGRLNSTVDVVLHSGAEVKWTGSYRRLEAPNVAGTRRIVDFTADRPGRSLVHVSTVAVFPFGGETPIAEESPLDHAGLLYGGYPQSKWVAEQLVRRAAAEGLDVTVLRPGTITGDSVTGDHNPASFLDQFLISCIQVGWAPAMEMPLDMTPVDFAAAVTAVLTARPERAGGAYHVTHPAPPRLAEVYDLVGACGYPLRREPFEAWRERLLAPAAGDTALARFAGYLTRARADFLRMPPYLSGRTSAAVPADVTCPAVDRRLIGTYLDAYVRAGYLAPPGQG